MGVPDYSKAPPRGDVFEHSRRCAMLISARGRVDDAQKYDDHGKDSLAEARRKDAMALLEAIGLENLEVVDDG